MPETDKAFGTDPPLPLPNFGIGGVDSRSSNATMGNKKHGGSEEEIGAVQGDAVS